MEKKNVKDGIVKEKEALLDISTAITRQRIRIDGELYELASPEDFEMHEFMWIADRGQKIGELMGESYNEKDGADLDIKLDDLAKKVVLVPDAIFKKLKASHKLAIIRVFSEAVESIGEIPRPNGGQESSPDSKDSTEEASKVGSTPS